MTNTETPSPPVPTTRLVIGMDAGGTQISAQAPAGEILRLPSGLGSMQAAIRLVIEHFGLPELLLIGGAGAPDEDGNIELTNRDWPMLNPVEFGEEIGCRIVVVNDMVIKAAGLDTVAVEVIRAVVVKSNATKTVVTVSSGVGNAQLEPDGTISSSEGGHTTWQPSPGGLEGAVLQTLQRKYPDQRFFSIEELIAGGHFHRLYRALNAMGPRLRSGRDRQRVEAAIEAGIGIGPILTELVLREEPDQFCVLFMEIVGSLLGQYLRNLALYSLADGGIYLTGGVMQPEVVRYLFDKTSLMESFFGGSTHNARLDGVPIYLVTDPDLGVKGALELALRS